MLISSFRNASLVGGDDRRQDGREGGILSRKCRDGEGTEKSSNVLTEAVTPW